MTADAQNRCTADALRDFNSFLPVCAARDRIAARLIPEAIFLQRLPESIVRVCEDIGDVRCIHEGRQLGMYADDDLHHAAVQWANGVRLNKCRLLLKNNPLDVRVQRAHSERIQTALNAQRPNSLAALKRHADILYLRRHDQFLTCLPGRPGQHMRLLRIKDESTHLRQPWIAFVNLNLAERRTSAQRRILQRAKRLRQMYCFKAGFLKRMRTDFFNPFRNHYMQKLCPCETGIRNPVKRSGQPHAFKQRIAERTRADAMNTFLGHIQQTERRA